MAKEEQSAGETAPDEPESLTRQEGAHGVGALLMASRLRCGEDLRYVSDMLHIRYLYLEAIEDDRFEDLPGPTYAIGFIRAYADHLGLDSDEVVRRLKAETSGSSGRLKLDFPVPIPESVVPGGAILLVGIFLAILAYGGWYISSSNDGAVNELTAPLPGRFSSLLAKDGPTLPDSKDAGPDSKDVGPDRKDVGPDRKDVGPDRKDVGPDRKDVGNASPAAPTASKVDENAPIKETGKKAEAKIAKVTSSDNPVTISPPEPVSPKKQDAPKPNTPAENTPGPGEAEQTAHGNNAADAVATTKSKINDEANVHADVTDGNAPGTGDLSSSQAKPSKDAATAAEVASADAAAEKKQMIAEPVHKQQTSAVEDSAPSQTSGDSSSSASDGSAPAPSPAPVPSPAPAPSPDVAASNIPAGRTYGLENDGSRITVRANSNSWIQVRDDIANQLLLTRLLRRGDSYRVPNRPGLKLLTGNAGALDILIDGEAVPSIGAIGVVRRGVALDVERLRQGTAVIE